MGNEQSDALCMCGGDNRPTGIDPNKPEKPPINPRQAVGAVEDDSDNDGEEIIQIEGAPPKKRKKKKKKSKKLAGGDDSDEMEQSIRSLWKSSIEKGCKKVERSDFLRLQSQVAAQYQFSLPDSVITDIFETNQDSDGCIKRERWVALTQQLLETKERWKAMHSSDWTATLENLWNHHDEKKEGELNFEDFCDLEAHALRQMGSPFNPPINFMEKMWAALGYNLQHGVISRDTWLRKYGQGQFLLLLDVFNWQYLSQQYLNQCWDKADTKIKGSINQKEFVSLHRSLCNDFGLPSDQDMVRIIKLWWKIVTLDITECMSSVESARKGEGAEGAGGEGEGQEGEGSSRNRGRGGKFNNDNTQLSKSEWLKYYGMHPSFGKDQKQVQAEAKRLVEQQAKRRKELGALDKWSSASAAKIAQMEEEEENKSKKQSEAAEKLGGGFKNGEFFPYEADPDDKIDVAMGNFINSRKFDVFITRAMPQDSYLRKMRLQSNKRNYKLTLGTSPDGRTHTLMVREVFGAYWARSQYLDSKWVLVNQLLPQRL